MLFSNFTWWLKGRPKVDLVVYEMPHLRGAAAVRILEGIVTRVLERCADTGTEHVSVHSNKLKTFALGKAPDRTARHFVCYKCGCSDGPKPKRQLLKYCATHGGDATEWILEIIPRMDRSKTAMIEAAQRRLNPLDLTAPKIFPPPGERMLLTMTEHEADALHLYWWAKENCGCG